MLKWWNNGLINIHEGLRIVGRGRGEEIPELMELVHKIII